MIDRRAMLLATGGLLLSTNPAHAAPPADLKTAARDAWLYGLPLIEYAAIRTKGAITGGEMKRAAGFTHNRTLAGPDQRGVTTPNNDTLYSTAFVDLGAGPATLVLPATGDRYFSVHFMDAYTNTFAILGTRTTGPDGGTFTLVGPRGAAPAGAVRSPTPWIWIVVRTLVDGQADLTAGHAVQDALRLTTAARRAPGTFAKRGDPWEAYFASVQALVIENPPPATDASVFRRFGPLGLTPRGGFDAAKFSPAQRGEIEAGVAEARSMLGRRGAGAAVGGWTYPPANLGDYGQDYLLRAQVALSGLGALTRAEAMYMRPVAPDAGGWGDGLYRLHFDAGHLPPLDGFWSMSMYEVTPEGQLFFSRNPLGRYAIGDRTQGLKRGADGSLDIWISRADPGGERTANWLPAPASGPYAMSFRAYLPKPELMDGRYRLPAIVKA
jgi:hypothetical protein